MTYITVDIHYDGGDRKVAMERLEVLCQQHLHGQDAITGGISCNQEV